MGWFDGKSNGKKGMPPPERSDKPRKGGRPPEDQGEEWRPSVKDRPKKPRKCPHCRDGKVETPKKMYDSEAGEYYTEYVESDCLYCGGRGEI